MKDPWNGSRTRVHSPGSFLRWLGRTGFILVTVALTGWTPLAAQQDDAARGTSTAERLERGDAGLVTAYARASVVQMQAYHQAHPNFQQLTGPATRTPPPQAVDEHGVIVVARDGDPPPTLGEPHHREGLAAGGVGGAAPAPALSQSFRGVIDNFTVIPPDTMGAVGPSHVVELLNTGFTVFDRAGALLSSQVSLQAFWSSLGVAVGQPAVRPFDPKIAYDQYTGRWVVTSDSRDNSNAWVLVGISQTSDPTGFWNLFGIRSNKNDGVFNHVNEWSDFPGMGLDPNNVIITNNMFPFAGGGAVHADVWVIAKTSLMAGGGALVQGTDYTVMHNPCGLFGFTFQPCHTFGPTSVNYIIDQGWFDSATRRRRLLRIKQISGTGAGATLACAGGDDWLEVAPYNFRKLDGPQPSCAARIDTGDARMLHAVSRNGKIWATHGVGIGAGVTDSAPPSRTQVAWYEINPAAAGAFPGGVPNQQGQVSDSALYYSYPSIAVNRDECVALGFSGMDDATFVGGYYTVRFATDSPGTMRTVAQLHPGQGHYLKQFGGTRNRWGDYSAMMVDPVDDQTFWTLQEYAEVPFGSLDSCEPNSGRWGTWWGAFRCAVGPPAKFSQPPTANGENIASNVDWVDGIPNVVVADDFISDGRPITGVRWWGGALETACTPNESGRCADGADNDCDGSADCLDSDCAADPACAVVPTDDCNLKPLVGEGVLSFDSTGATTDGPPATCATLEADMWVNYVASCDGTATIDTSGSAFDTVLEVYAGCACSPLGTVIDCNDDFAGLPQSQIDFPVTVGECFKVRVGGFSGDQGVGTLTIACGLPPAPCPGTGNCCVDNGTPGCDDEACCNLICGADPFCCDVTWDQACADLAVTSCDGCGGACTALNAGFEVGAFTPWTATSNGLVEFFSWLVGSAGTSTGFHSSAPLSGGFDALNGFDGEAGLRYELFQDVALPAGSAVSLTTNHRIQFDSLGIVSSLPREFDISIRDTSNAILTQLFHQDVIINGAPNTDLGWNTQVFDLSAFAGQTVRIHFGEFIPESITGPAMIEFDDIALSCTTPAGAPSSSDGVTVGRPTTRRLALASPTRRSAVSFDKLREKYMTLRERALATEGVPAASAPLAAAPVACPQPDGWLVSFHEPIDPGASPRPALGLYYCDAAVVQLAAVGIPTCNGVSLSEHTVDLAQCCLVHANVDPRSGLVPAAPSAFVEQECFEYAIDIQAVFGHRFVDAGGFCVEEPTGTTLDADCWGWHTTTISRGEEFGLGPALVGSIDMSTEEWLYGSWVAVTPVCSLPNMAFELLTDVADGPADNNGNGIADVCECACDADVNDNGTVDVTADIPAILACIGGDCSGCVNSCDVNCDGVVDDTDAAAALCRFSSGGFDACCGACPPTLAPDPVAPEKSRYASFSARNAGRDTALRVTLTQSTPFPSAVGSHWWVQLPTAISEASGKVDPADAPGFPTFMGAGLDCEPICADWGSMGEIHLFDRNLVSNSVYEIEAVDCTCDLSAEQSFSLPRPVPLARFGDVCGPGVGGACSTPPNAIVSILNDVVGTLDKFRNVPGAPSKARTDINPGQPDSKISIVDVTRGLDAFSGGGYPFSEPVGCPATGPRP